ncbi:MAG: DUF4363 family protein, partial [Candidatus Limousia pullorum]
GRYFHTYCGQKENNFNNSEREQKHMKRIYLAVIFLIFTIAAAFFELYIVFNPAKESIRLIEQATELCKNDQTSEAVEICREVSDLWAKSNPTINMFIQHEKTVEISSDIKEMTFCLENGEEFDFLLTAEKLKEDLKTIMDNELPHISNIL